MRKYLSYVTYIFFFLLALLFYAPFLSGARILAYRDLALYFFPFRYLMVKSVLGGHLPLWDRFVFCGHPLLATLQIGFFYPLTFIYYIVPFNLAFNYFSVIHYFLAGSFMYLLARHWGMKKIPATLAGLVFMLSGFLVSAANMNTTLTSITWLPLLFILFDRVLTDGRPRYTISLSLVFCLLFLGGEPTVSYISALMLFTYGLLSGRDFLRSAHKFIGAGVLALMLVSVQIIPFFELVINSVRTSRLSFEFFINMSSYPPRELVNLVVPFFWGNFIKQTYNKMLVGDNFQIWMLSAYVGIIPAVLMMFAFFRKNKIVFFLLAWAALSILLAMGKFTPVYNWAYSFFPGMKLIRYPVKFFSMAAFVMPLLAAFGLQNIMSYYREKKVALSFMGVLVVLMAVGFGILLFRESLYITYRSWFPRDLHFAFVDMIKVNFSAIIRHILVICLELAAVLVFFWLMVKGRIKNAVFGLVVILMVACDLFAANSLINIPVERQSLEGVSAFISPVINDKGLFRVFPCYEADASPVFYEDYSDVVEGLRDRFVPNLLITHNVSYLLGRESIESRRVIRLNEQLMTNSLEAALPLLSLYNVKYIFSSDKLNIKGLELANSEERFEGQFLLYRNNDHLPRAFLAAASRSVTGPEEALQALAVPGFSAYRTVIIENGPEKGSPFARGGLRFNSYDNNYAEIMVNTEDDCWLYMSDAMFPGWKALLDGKKVEIYNANYIGRAVFIPRGGHKVEFIYSPASFKIGALISGLTLLGLLGMGCYNLLLRK
ncbi:MAG: YfhO family protein [Candidatus Margulisiibacteriota bacterium]